MPAAAVYMPSSTFNRVSWEGGKSGSPASTNGWSSLSVILCLPGDRQGPNRLEKRSVIRPPDDVGPRENAAYAGDQAGGVRAGEAASCSVESIVWMAFWPASKARMEAIMSTIVRPASTPEASSTPDWTSPLPAPAAVPVKYESP